MNRMTNCFAGFLLTIAPLALAQEPKLTPQYPEDAFASQQLIAWSRLQKPQPAPQPLPPRDTPIPQPDQQSQQTKPPADPQNQRSANQSFTGKIVKDGARYVLRATNSSAYQLDAQDLKQQDLKQYENQDVKVIGNLDSASNTIRVVKIELLA
jgi:hypothetical protein